STKRPTAAFGNRLRANRELLPKAFLVPGLALQTLIGKTGRGPIITYPAANPSASPGATGGRRPRAGKGQGRGFLLPKKLVAEAGSYRRRRTPLRRSDSTT